MALQKEIWINSIVEQLFADNSFMARSVDHSEFVNNLTVHVPCAGAAPSVSKGRSVFPASVTVRQDSDLNYNIAEFSTDPIRIPNADQVELSYAKRESVLSASRSALNDAVAIDMIYNWIQDTTNKVATTGAGETAHIATATGSRKAITKADILAVKKLFDAKDVPAEGRYMLLDSVMYNQLLASLTESQSFAFLAAADATKGTVGNLYGFDFYMRSKAAKTAAAGTVKTWEASAAATDSAAGLAWQENCVSRAAGEHVIFEQEKDPTYYADVISAVIRAGGKYINTNGVCLIYQATA